MGRTAVYLDTSLVIDYMLATGRETEASAPIVPLESDFERKQREYWAALFRHSKRYHFATRLRSIIGWSSTTSRIVISPFVLLELDEWYSEECFKRHALEGTHVKAIQSHSRKEIGTFIQHVRRDSKQDNDSFASQIWYAITNGVRGAPLAGIEIDSVEELKFDSNAFQKVTLLSHLQLGMADIVHLLAAESLNCTHFASTDSDFNRLRTEIEEAFNFRILYKDEIFNVVRAK